MATKKADALDTYQPPQRCIGPCKDCGAPVIGRLWKNGAFVDQYPRLTPALGYEHVCQGMAPTDTEEPRDA